MLKPVIKSVIGPVLSGSYSSGGGTSSGPPFAPLSMLWHPSGVGVGGFKDNSVPSGALTLTGTPSQLGVVQITTDGTYDFGTVSHGAMKHYAVGGRAWLDGVEVTLTDEVGAADGALLTASNAFHTVNSFAAKRPAAGRGGFAYMSNISQDHIGAPKPDSAIGVFDPATTGKWFQSETIRYLSAPFYTRTTAFTGDGSGLIAPDEQTFDRGEPITIVKAAGAGTISGFFVGIEGGLVTFDIGEGNGFTSSNANGGTITGDTSGTVITMSNSSYFVPSSSKPIRASTDDSDQTPGPGIVGLGFIAVGTRGSVLDVDQDSQVRDDYRPTVMEVQSRDWQSWQFTSNHNGGFYVCGFLQGGSYVEETHPNTFGADFNNVIHRMKSVFLAPDWAATGGVASNKCLLKDSVMDDEFARVVVMPVSDLSLADDTTPVGVCGRIAWASNACDVRVNWGEIQTGVQGYGYVYNSDGACINPTAPIDFGVAP